MTIINCCTLYKKTTIRGKNGEKSTKKIANGFFEIIKNTDPRVKKVVQSNSSPNKPELIAPPKTRKIDVF